MTRIQKILLAALLIIFVIFLVLIFVINSYNDITQLDANAISQWSSFEKVYQPRYEQIVALNNRVARLKPGQDLNGKMNQRLVNYAQSRTVDSRIVALIDLEVNLKELDVMISGDSSLQSDAQIKQEFNDLKKTEPELLDAREKYNTAAQNYNQTISQMPDSLIASYFGLKPKTFLPVIWAQ